LPALEKVRASSAALPGPKALAWFVARSLAATRIDRPEDYEPALSLTWEVLADGSYGPEDMDLFMDHLCCQTKGDFFSIYIERFVPLTTAPALPEWARLTVTGTINASRGRRVYDRQRDAAPTAQTQSPTDYFDNARRAFTRAWQLRPSQPHAATGMIDVTVMATPVPGETPRLWFDRAIAAQFDYEQAYCRLLWAYRPDWGGSIEEMLAFGEACRRTGSHSTLVPYFALEAALSAAQQTRDWKSVYRQNPAMAEGLVELCTARVNDPERKYARTRSLGLLGVHAFLAGDLAKAAETMKPLGAAVPRPAWSLLMKLRIMDFDEQVRMAQSGGGADFVRGEAQLAKGDLDGAADSFAGAVEKLTGDEKARAQSLYAYADFKRRYAREVWVPLEAAPSSPIWKRVADSPVLPPRFTPAKKGNDRTPQRQDLRYSLGDSFEVRGEFASDAGAPSDFATEIYLSVRPTGPEPSDTRIEPWVRVCVRHLDSGQSGVSLFDANARLVAPEQTLKLKPTNTFVYRLQAGHVSLEINGAAVFTNCVAPQKTNEYEEVMFGFSLSPYVRQQPTKLEVRKVVPPEPSAPSRKEKKASAQPVI
jgi:hypothetical protein